MAELRLLNIRDIFTSKSLKIEDLTVQQKVCSSVQRFGQTETLLVYSNLLDETHGFLLIKGHSILKALIANERPYAYCFIINSEPELAVVVHNSLKQRVDSVEMAYLVHSLLEVYTKNDLVQITGYSMEELTTFEQLFDYEWNKLSEKKQKHKDQIKMF